MRQPQSAESSFSFSNCDFICEFWAVFFIILGTKYTTHVVFHCRPFIRNSKNHFLLKKRHFIFRKNGFFGSVIIFNFDYWVLLTVSGARMTFSSDSVASADFYTVIHALSKLFAKSLIEGTFWYLLSSMCHIESTYLKKWLKIFLNMCFLCWKSSILGGDHHKDHCFCLLEMSSLRHSQSDFVW